MAGLLRRFDQLPSAHQLLALSLVLDPIGAIGGYLLAPSVGVDPILGAVFGLIAASVPTGLLVAFRAT